MNIRNVVEKDAALLRDFARHCPPLDLHTPYTYWVLCKFFAESCFIVSDDDVDMGYIMAFEAEKIVFVWQIGVLPEHRGKGCTRFLIDSVVQFAREKNKNMAVSIAKENVASYGSFSSYCNAHAIPFQENGSLTVTDLCDLDFVETEIIYEMQLLDNSDSVRSKYEKLTKYLIEKNITIATMESATAGQIASLITDTEGSSAVLKGALVTYSNEAKIKHGVPSEIIEKYSVYSKETAFEMAKACAEAFDAEIGIGVTGTMGNVDPCNRDASVPGEVFYGLAIRNKDANGYDIFTYQVQLPVQKTRFDYKLAVADLIYDSLNELLVIE